MGHVSLRLVTVEVGREEQVGEVRDGDQLHDNPCQLHAVSDHQVGVDVHPRAFD